MDSGYIASAITTLLGTAFAYFIVKLWRARAIFLKLKKQGLPMPEHSFATGHLLILGAIVKLYPSEAIKTYLFGELSRRYAKGGACYVDLWPLAEPFLLITSPHLANQVTSTPIAYEKPEALRKWFWSITGGISMFDAPAEEWKPMRALMNRGFSSNHLNTLIPSMVEVTQVYCQKLREHVREGDMFYMDSMNLLFMLDVIGEIGLNVNLGCQSRKNPLTDALRNQIAWKISNQEVNPLQWLNVARTIVEWYNGRVMDRYIEKEVEKRFKESQQDKGNSEGGSQSIIDIALQDYMADPSRIGKNTLDKAFKTFAKRNMRLLLFAGHDSAGSTISYCYYNLSKNPDALARIRAEHDSVLGTDLSKAGPAISADPHILNKIPYTNAVIKEALRLFPPASSIRQGLEGVDLVDEEGNRYPTANCMVHILHLTIQRDPRYFVRPNEFLPERWLVGPEDPLYPKVKGAWRPFEYGPRNCIGQLLVTLDVKVALALTVREFDITPAYEEWDKLNPRKDNLSVDGERAYMVDKGAAHPVDGFPCRVFLRSSKSVA